MESPGVSYRRRSVSVTGLPQVALTEPAFSLCMLVLFFVEILANSLVSRRSTSGDFYSNLAPDAGGLTRQSISGQGTVKCGMTVLFA